MSETFASCLPTPRVLATARPSLTLFVSFPAGFLRKWFHLQWYRKDPLQDDWPTCKLWFLHLALSYSICDSSVIPRSWLSSAFQGGIQAGRTRCSRKNAAISSDLQNISWFLNAVRRRSRQPVSLQGGNAYADAKYPKTHRWLIFGLTLGCMDLSHHGVCHVVTRFSVSNCHEVVGEGRTLPADIGDTQSCTHALPLP